MQTLSACAATSLPQKQRVIADRLEVPVVGAAFLLPMHRALARIHVEPDAVGVLERFGLSNQVSVYGHQPDEVLLASEQTSVSNQCSVEISAALRSHRVGDPISRNVGSVERRASSLRSS